MKMKSILFTLFSLVIFSGCTQVDNYKIIKTGDYTMDGDGTKEDKVYYSDSTSDVQNFIDDFKNLTDDKAPEFTGSMIISKSGTKSSGGYKMSVESVVDAGRFTVVTTLLEAPGKGCLVTLALTNPYIVIEIPDNHKEIKFDHKVARVDCK